MALDPISLTPRSGAGLPAAGFPVAPLLRPASFGCLSGTIPTIPAFTPSAYYTATRTIHDVVTASAAAGSVLFFGDSITQEIDVSQVSPFGVNFGINGDTLEGLLNRLAAHSGALGQARAVCVAIGINNVTAGASAATVQDYLLRVLNWLSGPLVWCKILPTTNATWNGVIDTVNAATVSALAGRANCAIVDVRPSLVDGSSLLRADLAVDDRHLNAAGQAIWRAGIKTALASV